MPANLSPEYKAAEDEYRTAKDPQTKLACLEKMLSTIPKHKGTEKMQADLKRRISRLKDGLQKKSGKKGFSVAIDKEGAAQVVLVGAPNAGKSALVEVTTNARTEVADYPFSTRSPIPAMQVFENLQFQLVDLPPVSDEYMEPWVTDIIRSGDSAMWVIDAADPDLKDKLDLVRRILENKKILLVGHDEKPNRGGAPIRRMPSIVVATKQDQPAAARGTEQIKDFFEPRIEVLAVSAMEDSDFSQVGQSLFELNRIVRVFSKTPGKDADLSKPYVMHRGDRLIDFAEQVHKDFAKKLRYARIWGAGKFDGQRIQRDQELVDGDIVELHT